MLDHIIRTQDFDLEFISSIFQEAKSCRDYLKKKNYFELALRLRQYAVATLFYEPSTRTRLSFETAVARLGARNITTENASQFSSAAKGESLRDTISVMSCYADCIVLRHKEKGSAQEASIYSKVPIINAGDGDGQHPTQSLLDLFTIENHFDRVSGLTVVLSGDLMYSRTVHSLAYLLAKYDNVKLFLASPPGLELPQDIMSYLERHGVQCDQFDSLVRAVRTGEADVVYHTRPQKERYLSRDSLISYEECKENFTITRDLANEMKEDAIILHPLPRTDEIRYGVDENHRAKYFEQAENGLYVRMALIQYLLRR